MERIIFGSEARDRLIDIDPENGAVRFEKAHTFSQVALKNLHTPLVVPPALDHDLHEILSARDCSGNGLEKLKIRHHAAPFLGATLGKTLSEVEHPDARRTIDILESNGIKLDQVQYSAPACIFQVVES